MPEKKVDRVDENGSETQNDESSAESKAPSYESYRKVLNEKKTLAAEMKKMQDRLAQIESEKESEEEAKLQSQKQFETLAEKHKKERDTYKQKFDELNNRIVVSAKRSALDAEIGGVLKPEYLEFADLSKIRILDNGEVDKDSLKEVADAYRTEHPHLLRSVSTGKSTAARTETDSKSEDDTSYKDIFSKMFPQDN